jgi:DNA-binding response OmpR family regulator
MSSLPVPHVLVVDDDAAVRELREYLGNNDFRVTSCATGTQLMDALRAGAVDRCSLICGCATRTACSFAAAARRVADQSSSSPEVRREADRV